MNLQAIVYKLNRGGEVHPFVVQIRKENPRHPPVEQD